MKTRIALLAATLLATASAAAVPETRMTVTLPASWQGDASGRLLIFAKPVKPADTDADKAEVDTSTFDPQAVSVAARDVATFGKERAAQIDTQEVAFPAGFAALPAGDYRVQAVLDRNGDYNYGGRGPGDLVSKVVTVHLPEQAPATIPLDMQLPQRATWDFSSASKDTQDTIAAARPHLHEVLFQSPSLSAFWGRPITLKAWVLTPPDYDAKAHQSWPTVFQTGGFGSTHHNNIAAASRIWKLEADKAIPSMIWVFLDHSSLGTGTTEFADSVNNGPWGHALTTELMPQLERDYRMDAKPSGRFLTGHSSGGWSTLWLQVRYPKVFGGTWSTAPDPSDFHDFTGADLYAADANFYHDAAGKRRPLIRDHDKLIATIPDFARLEAVLGHDGGQFRSFDWVFSPRAKDGTPMEMFDRTTGGVHPEVVAYWRDHYDIAHLIETRWPELKPDLDGKVHLIVGTADTFYLDGAAHRLDAVMKKVGAHASFTYVPNKTHMDLYERDGDKRALSKDIAWAMYAVARPGSKRPAEAH
jgi:enterochelin esterase-like enzyme/uncharacterized protein (DUF2141 family)